MMISKQFAFFVLLPQVFGVSGFLSSSSKRHEVVKGTNDAVMMLQGTRYPSLYSLDDRPRTRSRVDTSYLTNLQKRLDSTLQKVEDMERALNRYDGGSGSSYSRGVYDRDNRYNAYGGSSYIAPSARERDWRGNNRENFVSARDRDWRDTSRDNNFVNGSGRRADTQLTMRGSSHGGHYGGVENRYHYDNRFDVRDRDYYSNGNARNYYIDPKSYENNHHHHNNHYNRGDSFYGRERAASSYSSNAYDHRSNLNNRHQDDDFRYGSSSFRDGSRSRYSDNKYYNRYLN